MIMGSTPGHHDQGAWMTTTHRAGTRAPLPATRDSEVFLPESEPDFATDRLDLTPEAARPAEEDFDRLGAMPLGDRGELLVPVGAAHVRLALQPREQIGVTLLVQQLARQVQ